MPSIAMLMKVRKQTLAVTNRYAYSTDQQVNKTNILSKPVKSSGHMNLL